MDEFEEAMARVRYAEGRRDGCLERFAAAVRANALTQAERELADATQWSTVHLSLMASAAAAED